MDQRPSHLDADRVRLLMDAARLTTAYLNANPELEAESQGEYSPVVPPHEVVKGK